MGFGGGAGAFGALAPVAESFGFVRGDVVERDVRVRDRARHQCPLAEPNNLRSRGDARLGGCDDESEFDRPGQGHVHRHGSRLGDTFYLNHPKSVNPTHGYRPIFLAGAEIIDLIRR
jgi:hypothetical protein